MMKLLSRKEIYSLLIIFLMVFTSTAFSRDFYQIKIYTIKDQQQESRVENYLEKAYLPALHRAGINDVGVFKPIESDDAAGKKIFVLIPLKKLNQLESLEEKLAKDKKYLESEAVYINTTWDNPPYERMESIILKAFKDFPEYHVPDHSTAPSEQIYELRSYEGPTEERYRKKVEMFNKGGEAALFEKLGFQPVFFGEVISGGAMPNLMYMTTFSDMESNKKHWDTFRNHPEWKEMSGLEEYKHTVSHIDKYLLHPTAYSDI